MSWSRTVKRPSRFQHFLSVILLLAMPSLLECLLVRRYPTSSSWMISGRHLKVARIISRLLAFCSPWSVEQVNEAQRKGSTSLKHLKPCVLGGVSRALPPAEMYAFGGGGGNEKIDRNSGGGGEGKDNGSTVVIPLVQNEDSLPMNAALLEPVQAKCRNNHDLVYVCWIWS